MAYITNIPEPRYERHGRVPSAPYLLNAARLLVSGCGDSGRFGPDHADRSEAFPMACQADKTLR